MKKFLKWAGYTVAALIALIFMLNLNKEDFRWGLLFGAVAGGGVYFSRRLDSIERQLQALRNRPPGG